MQLAKTTPIGMIPPGMPRAAGAAAGSGPGSGFSLKKSAPAIFVIGFHVVLFYALAAGLGYVRVPFEEPHLTVIDLPTQPVDKTEPDPIKVDAKMLNSQPVETIEAPKLDVEITNDQPVTDTTPIATQANSTPGESTPTMGVRLLNHPEPPYPAVSRQQGEEGTAMVRVTIVQGKVTDAQLATSSGFSRLDDAAVKGVRTWRFSPASSTTVIIPVKFQLNTAK